MKKAFYFYIVLASCFLNLRPAKAHICLENGIVNKAVNDVVGFLTRSGLSADLDLLKLGKSDQVFLDTNYVLKIKESEENPGTFNRLDSFKIGIFAGVDRNLDDATESTTGAVIGQSASLQVRFRRHFSDPCEATLQTPYWVTEMPFKVPGNKKSPTKTVLEELKVGDIVSTTGVVRFVVGPEFLQELGVVEALQLQAKVGVSYLIEGTFTVHVLKIDKQRIVVKLEAAQDKFGAGFLRVGVVGETLLKGLGLDSGINELDKVFAAVLDFKLVKFNMALGTRKLSTIEYYINLSDVKASQAFDEMMKVSNGLHTVESANDLFWGEEVKHVILLNTQKLEELSKNSLSPNSQRSNPTGPASKYSQPSSLSVVSQPAVSQAKYSRAVENAIVKRIDAEAVGVKTKTGLDLDFEFFKFKSRSLYLGDSVSVFHNDAKQCARVKTSANASIGGFLFGLLKWERERELTSVISSSCSKANSLVDGLILKSAKKYDEFGKEQLQLVKKELRRVFSAQWLERLRFQTPMSKKEARAGYELILSLEIFKKWQKAFRSKITENRYQVGPLAVEELIVKYLYSLQNQGNGDLLRGLIKTDNPPATTAFQRNIYGTNPWVQRLSGSIARLSLKLNEFFESDFSKEKSEPLALFQSLQTDPLFSQMGLGFLISLLSYEELSEFVHFRLYLPGVPAQELGNERLISTDLRLFLAARDSLNLGELKQLAEISFLADAGKPISPQWNPLKWWDRFDDEL